MKTELISQRIRPRDCERAVDGLALKESVKFVGRFWMMIQHDGAVILTEQANGKPAKSSVTIPRHVFHQLICWYETEQ